MLQLSCIVERVYVLYIRVYFGGYICIVYLCVFLGVIYVLYIRVYFLGGGLDIGIKGEYKT